jgi:hypothetical protein
MAIGKIQMTDTCGGIIEEIVISEAGKKEPVN